MARPLRLEYDAIFTILRADPIIIWSFLPKFSRYRDVTACLKADRILCADGAADTASVASPLVYHGLFICSAVSYGTKLADAHALPAAVALAGIDSGDIFGTEHNGNSLCHRAAHSQAIRAVAVAHSRDEGGVKGPNAVTKTFLLVAAQGGNGLVFAELLETVRIGAIKKAAVKAGDDLAEFPAVWCEADAVAVTFFAAERNVAAEAGDTNNGIHKAEDLLDVLDRHDLPIMDLLHLSADKPSDDGPYEARSLLEFFQTVQTFFV